MNFNNYAYAPIGAANGIEAVTPSDTETLEREARRIYIGTSGNIAIVARDGSTAIFSSVPAGTFIDVVTSQILATGTTATNIVGMY